MPSIKCKLWRRLSPACILMHQGPDCNGHSATGGQVRFVIVVIADIECFSRMKIPASVWMHRWSELATADNLWPISLFHESGTMRASAYHAKRWNVVSPRSFVGMMNLPHELIVCFVCPKLARRTIRDFVCDTALPGVSSSSTPIERFIVQRLSCVGLSTGAGVCSGTTTRWCSTGQSLASFMKRRRKSQSPTCCDTRLGVRSMARESF